MPSFPIVDTHVHLYDVDRLSYPWMAGAPAIASTHLVADFDEARGSVEVDTMVFAEVDVAAGRNVDEAAFVAELAASESRLKGMIACARVERGAAVADELDQMQGYKILRGIRRLIQSNPDPEFCIRPEFIEGVRLLPRYDLSFDICIYHHQLPAAIQLVRSCPEVQFVLDHIGKPGIKDGLVEPWKSGIRDLAALPNVVCKVSGVATEADHANWSREQLRPYIEHVIETFGFNRVMFGGDWPVLELAGKYPDWVAILDWIVEGSSDTEKRALYRDTAIRVYRLDA
jgi:L-fuconolactonase